MNLDKRKKKFETRKQEMVERLSDRFSLFPYPALISFALVLWLTGFILPKINPRTGQIASSVQLNASEQTEGMIWFAVKIIDNETVVQTHDNRIFRWSRTSLTREDLKPFRQYLKEQVRKRIFLSALAKNARLAEITAVISADQNLRYIHLKPIINALAEAKITRYGFETRIAKNNNFTQTGQH